jgi:DNA-binding winged helix-turn-helix (wHTH) protein
MWRFGNVRFDPVRRVLSSGSQSLHLPPREADLLRVLLEAGGKPVSKDTLLATIWTDCAVEEGNLTQQVSLLRRALASLGGSDTHYIETIPKLGYRFQVPARQLPPTLDAPRRKLYLAAAILILAAILWALLFYSLGASHH